MIKVKKHEKRKIILERLYGMKPKAHDLKYVLDSYNRGYLRESALEKMISHALEVLKKDWSSVEVNVACMIYGNFY